MIKMNLKALVAAVALVGASSHAVADIQPGNLTSGATGGELMFYAFDDVAKTSYVKDLGITYAAFLATPTYAGSANNISSDANWGSYLGSVGNDTSNTYWGVLATEKTSALTANGVNLLTTARGNTTATTLTSAVRGIDGVINTTYLGALQGTGTNYAANLSYFATGATNNANFAAGAGIGHNYNGKVSFLADNKIGDAASFFRLSAAASATTAATLSTVIDTPVQWTFNGNTLQVTAVPEPETYALMIAGLLMIGSIARRRKSA